MELDYLRQQIDATDRELVRIFMQRMRLSASVAKYKAENNLPIYVPDREAEILLKLAELSEPGMDKYLAELYSKIFELSRIYQAEII